MCAARLAKGKEHDLGGELVPDGQRDRDSFPQLLKPLPVRLASERLGFLGTSGRALVGRSASGTPRQARASRPQINAGQCDR